jgi:hypothetical protein
MITDVIMAYMANKLLSANLVHWLKSDKPKTLASLVEIFGERSIAIVILVLMLFPSLPIPTGGLTNILEIVAMLLALEMIIGRKTIWLPKKILSRNLGVLAQEKVIPFMNRRIIWLEKHSRPWGKSYLVNNYFLRFTGLILLLLAINSFIAPPFSGLDTFPAFAAVLISISLILEDLRFFILGFVIGSVSVITYIFFGTIIFEFIKNLYYWIF